MSSHPPFLHLSLLPSTFPPAMLSMRWHTKTPVESACFELQHSSWAWKKHALHSPKMKHDFRCWYVNCRNVKGTFFLSQYSFLLKYCAGLTWAYCIEESLRNIPFLPRAFMCLFTYLKSHQIPATWFGSCAWHCLSGPCLLWPPVHIELPWRNSQIVFFYGRLVLPVRKEQQAFNILTEMHQKVSVF